MAGIRGERVGIALNILHFSKEKAATVIEKTLRSAVANLMVMNADENINPETLHIKESFVNGWFKNTCLGFDYKKPVAQFIHIDCDVYSSTVDVFNTLGGKVVPGTVIVFDDYCNYTGWRVGEWKAWQDFVQKQNLNYEYLDVGGMAVSLIVR